MVRRRLSAVSNHEAPIQPHPSRRGQRVRAKRGPMINSDAAPQDKGGYCDDPSFRGASETSEPGISRFRVRSFGPSRNDALKNLLEQVKEKGSPYSAFSNFKQIILRGT